MEKSIGQITHYFGHIGVAVIKLSSELKVGDNIHVVVHGADFNQAVDSMQVENAQIEVAKAGDDVGMKVNEKVKPGAEVFLVE